MTPSAALAQDDTYAQDNAWVPELVQAPAAWETTQGEGITVAVLDTGINEHPFFEGKDVLPGHSAASSEEDGWNDTDGHGSAVAAGVLLVAPEATIMPVRVGTGESILSGALGPTQFDAFRWAVDNGADILVVPWGLSGASQDTFDGEYLEVLQYAIDKGAIVIAAAGNEAGEPVEYPAFVPGVVAVTGTDRNGNIWYENTTVGPEIAVAAPADEMTAPLPQDSSLGNTELYRDVIGGTSMGSGITGGVAALAWAAHPQLDASNVIQRMIQTAGEGSGGKSDDFGYGLLNADQAVHAQDIAPVEENPLGYPMGEAGASGVSPDEASSEEAAESSPAPAGPSAAAAEGNKESNLSSIIVVAAAVVLLGAAIAVWLVLRGRGRKSAAPANAGNFRPGDGPGPGAYQQPAAAQQQYSPPMGGGPGFGAPQSPQQGFSSPPPQQGFNPPPGNAEQSPPGRPSDPNRQ
nr:S8 family serine peptidase [Glycomyces sp. TRM65418]